jgi:hypothetical protein
MFSNCFFIGNYLNNSDKNSVYILNCNFLNYSGGTAMFNNVSYLNVHNSIFWNNAVNGCTSCVFNNNLTYDDVTRDLPTAGSTGSGNINNTDPQFSSTFPAPSINITYANLKSYNWNLKATSPG